nr:prolipoprotein diacylglyceryl transferase [bacterium]
MNLSALLSTGSDIGVAFQLGPFTVRWYGIVIALGALLAIVIASRLAPRRGIKADCIFDVALLAIPMGVIGGRLYYVLFELDYYLSHPEEIIRFWEGGMAIYGAVIGGLIAVIIYAKWKKINLWRMTDCIVVGLVLAQCIGRWGNFFNQEAYGNPVINPALQFFPYAVFIDARNMWYQATFFYESAWDFLVFLALLWYFNGCTFRRQGALQKPQAEGVPAKKLRPRYYPRVGNVTALYFGLYGLGRTFIELLRSDSLMWGPIRVSSMLSLLLVIAASIVLFKRRSVPCTCDCAPTCTCGCREGLPCTCDGSCKAPQDGGPRLEDGTGEAAQLPDQQEQASAQEEPLPAQENPAPDNLPDQADGDTSQPTSEA